MQAKENQAPEDPRSSDALVLTSQALQPVNGIYTLQHLGLLHHFTSSTALTLSIHGRVQKLWQVDIPHIGLSFPFVIHAILALSSMHMAHDLPDEHQAHWASSIELQQQAVTGAQKELNNITTENCSAVFLFSALTCVISLARGCGHSPKCSPDNKHPSETGWESLLEWVVLYRGTRHLLGPPYEEVLHSGPLKPMFELGIERKLRLLAPLATPNTAKSIAFSKLQAAIYDRVEDAKRLDAYDTTTDHLRRAFHAVYDKPLEELENMDVFAWIFAVPDYYVALLKQQDPIALALFACFACLIREMRRMWWTHGRGECCISQILYKLRREEEWLVEHVVNIID
ncbi:C6 zinc finger [Fusarium pseudocircinatum]|uniref:C6 zinc finger n=1 Tax=Fusarium pseudocircinatum TaxID=56676 RepID=A0A8H5V0K7_9HYPO|nr:C6 zinc finger [Fusarium pseudocircinatum]